MSNLKSTGDGTVTRWHLAAMAVTAAIISAAIMTLSGCSEEERPPGAVLSEEQAWEDQPGVVRIVTDPITGCQYIGWSRNTQGGGITPRLNHAGRPMCKDVQP